MIVVHSSARYDREVHVTDLNRLRRIVLLTAATLALAVAVGVPGASASMSTIRTEAIDAALGYSTNTPMILHSVSLADITSNRGHICHSTFTHVIKTFSTISNTRNYLTAAATCGLKVIAFFSSTVNYTTGTVYPSRVAAWVNIAKGYPALWGYLTVKEPSWNRISASEIRSLYHAFRVADPSHPVMALFGDIPHFGSTANPYTAGMANVVMVDWYPIETSRSGCSLSGTTYITYGPKWYSTKVRPTVAAKTPGVPIWVMVQTHKTLAPTCHKKQLPTLSLLQREVREAFTYAGATGIAFHMWDNTSYTMDDRRNPTMISWMKSIAASVAAGTFH
jgi:hypothetical protein